MSVKTLSNGAHDSLNEEALIQSMSDEQQERFNKFKQITLSALKAGKGIDELCATVEYGYHDRAIMCKDKILVTLNLVLSPEEKSVIVASELIKF